MTGTICFSLVLRRISPGIMYIVLINGIGKYSPGLQKLSSCPPPIEIPAPLASTTINQPLWFKKKTSIHLQIKEENKEHESQSVNRSVVSDSLWPRGLQSTRLFCLWNSPGKNTGGDCHFLLQGIFLTQGSNAGLLHCRWIRKVVEKWHYLCWNHCTAQLRTYFIMQINNCLEKNNLVGVVHPVKDIVCIHPCAHLDFHGQVTAHSVTPSGNWNCQAHASCYARNVTVTCSPCPHKPSSLRYLHRSKQVRRAVTSGECLQLSWVLDEGFPEGSVG